MNYIFNLALSWDLFIRRVARKIRGNVSKSFTKTAGPIQVATGLSVGKAHESGTEKQIIGLRVVFGETTHGVDVDYVPVRQRILKKLTQLGGRPTDAVFANVRNFKPTGKRFFAGIVWLIWNANQPSLQATLVVFDETT